VGGGRVPALDGLRALAAMGVVVTHVAFATGAYGAGLPGALLSRFDVGVAVFFALSGYLLYRPHARAATGGPPAPAVRVYLVRRALRILPAYVVAVVVTFAALPAARARLSELPAHLVLLQTLRPGHLVAGLTQTWSLAPEAWFYLLLPLWVVLLGAVLPALAGAGRSPTAEIGALVLLGAVAPGWLALVHGTGFLGGYAAALWLPAYTSWFAVGMLVAVLDSRPNRARQPDRPWLVAASSPGACWVTAGALLVVAATPVAGALSVGPGPDPAAAAVTKNLLYAAVAGLLLLPLVLGRRDTALDSALSSRPARAVGRWSYSLFLLHLLALELALRVTGTGLFSGRFWLVLLVTVPVAVALAAASWRLVERPTQRLGRRWAERADDGADRDQRQQLSRSALGPGTG
jgi:peptidoglycan/LPS O-acetylase OafA/YrhL